MTESRSREDGDLVRIGEEEEAFEETVSSTGAGEDETAGITKRSRLLALRVDGRDDEDAEAEDGMDDEDAEAEEEEELRGSWR